MAVSQAALASSESHQGMEIGTIWKYLELAQTQTSEDTVGTPERQVQEEPAKILRHSNHDILWLFSSWRPELWSLQRSRVEGCPHWSWASAQRKPLVISNSQYIPLRSFKSVWMCSKMLLLSAFPIWSDPINVDSTQACMFLGLIQTIWRWKIANSIYNSVWKTVAAKQPV